MAKKYSIDRFYKLRKNFTRLFIESYIKNNQST